MAVYFDFSTVLTIGTLACGAIWAIDHWGFKAKRRARLATQTMTDGPVKDPHIVEFAKSFFPVLLVVLILRSFLAEPYRIPSGSMKPTLLEGDFILVNKYNFGLRWPVTGSKFLNVNTPKRGDIMVFRAPHEPSVKYIKRVVGLPGDTISYKNKAFYINGEQVAHEYVAKNFETNPFGQQMLMNEYAESLNGIKHPIFLQNSSPAVDVAEQEVPEGHYFVAGDNRDNSLDSRSWGFVSDEFVVGKAVYVWMSWDAKNKDIRWHRLGNKI